MKYLSLLLTLLLPVSESQGKGHATVEWIPEKMEVIEGSAVRTVIRMQVDEGWHTYWANPGEVGIPVKIKPQLPEGWIAGEIQYPAPHRITVSELTSFCFEGEVLLPVTLSPPSGFSGKIPTIGATISWLACNDQSCVPGKQEVALRADSDPKIVSKAYDELPKAVPGAKLTITEDGETLRLGLILPVQWKADLSVLSVFPITKNIIAPSSDFKFTRSKENGHAWTASAAKDEYYEKLPESFSVLLSDGSGTAWAVSTEVEPAPNSNG